MMFSRIYLVLASLFFEIAKKTERSWSKGMRMPLSVVSALFAYFVGIHIVLLMFILLFYTNQFWPVWLPLFIPLTYFINYYYLTKNYHLIADELKRRRRKATKTRFIVLVGYTLLTTACLALFVNYSINVRNRTICAKLKTLTVGASVFEAQKIVVPNDRFLTENGSGDSVYFYSLKTDSIRGIQIHFNGRTKKITWINFISE